MITYGKVGGYEIELEGVVASVHLNADRKCQMLGERPRKMDVESGLRVERVSLEQFMGR